jgi:hypothetical protein
MVDIRTSATFGGAVLIVSSVVFRLHRLLGGHIFGAAGGTKATARAIAMALEALAVVTLFGTFVIGEITHTARQFTPANPTAPKEATSLPNEKPKEKLQESRPTEPSDSDSPPTWGQITKVFVVLAASFMIYLAFSRSV